MLRELFDISDARSVKGSVVHRSERITSSHDVLVRGRLHFRLYVTSGFLLESGDKDSVIHPEKSDARGAQSDESVLGLGGAWCLRAAPQAASLAPSPFPPREQDSRTEG